jgi:hypothetical protein
VVVQTQNIASAWRRGLAIRLGKNLSFAHLTLIGDSAGETGTEQQGIWVSASVFSDQAPDCSPLNDQGQHSGAWGFYPDTPGGHACAAWFPSRCKAAADLVRYHAAGVNEVTIVATPPRDESRVTTWVEDLANEWVRPAVTLA